MSTPEKTASGVRAPWSATFAIFVIAVDYYVSQIAGGILVGLYPVLLRWTSDRSDEWLNNSVWAQFFYVLFTEGITLLILWLFGKRYKKAIKRAIGLARKPRLKDIGFALVGLGVYFGLYMIVFGVINSIVSVDTSQEQAVGFHGAHGGALILTFISLVVLPPIVEEIVFRGVLYSGIRRKLSPILATIATSLLFAAPHLLTGKAGLLWIAAIDTFSLSLVLCYLREKTGALYSGMLIHAAKNAIAFMALFIIAS